MKGYKVMCIEYTPGPIALGDIYHEEYTGAIHTLKEDAEAELKAAEMDPYCLSSYIQEVEL